MVLPQMSTNERPQMAQMVSLTKREAAKGRVVVLIGHGAKSAEELVGRIMRALRGGEYA
jgi:C-terminal processing protease CtpA/Prc